MKRNKILSDDGITIILESTKGRTFSISKEDEWVLENNWTIGTNGYCIRRYTINKKVYYETLHRKLMNVDDDRIIDHKDCDPTNNTRINLRICNQAQNSRNQSKQKRDTHSKYKGVSFTFQTNKWAAKIKKNKITYHLGYHKIEETAALAYNKKALELFVEFAKINIIE